MATLSIDDKKLRAITKAAGAADADPKKVLADLMKAFTPAEPVEVEGHDVDANDPVAAVFKGLFTAVTAIGKADGVDQEAELQEAFTKAFNAMSDLVEDSAAAAFEAGSIAKRGRKSADDSDDDGDDDADADNGDDGDDDGDGDDMEKILKRLPAGARGYVTALQKSVSDMAKQLNVLNADRERTEVSAVLKRIGEPESSLPTFIALRKSDAKLFETVTKTIESKNTAIRKAGLFSEQGGGSGNGDGASANDQLAAHAAEIVKNSNGKTTFAKAYSQACQEHPDLYREHRAGR